MVDATGGTAGKLTSLKGAVGNPRWSNDGKALAFLFVDNVYLIPAEGGSARNITREMSATASSKPIWLATNRILIAEWVDGEAGFAQIDFTQGSIEPLWTHNNAS